MTDLELEFEHIYLEVRAQRWQQIERFLLSYYCYKHGYTNKQGKPDWQLARQHSLRSTVLVSLNDSALEPVVPLKVIVGEIKRYWRDGVLTPSSLKRILDSLLHFVTLSKQELAALKQAGLSHSMPAHWYQSPRKSPLARFEQLAITLEGVSNEFLPPAHERK
ncbi:hypothetical protein FCU94_06125 [Vibrio sp. JPW-9-11-11]|uniref:hypothetical protein n=1 Tax=Vibrio sp. JPW-9-11-11 TaxID=1416532 RepID=UPI001592C0E5|nr:hypothetical protein [Vibrio sp. JPW-9-11-11]NVD06485.1 hypothetical protein [Vibrio sp. JPW-9-11-11]